MTLMSVWPPARARAPSSAARISSASAREEGLAYATSRRSITGFYKMSDPSRASRYRFGKTAYVASIADDLRDCLGEMLGAAVPERGDDADPIRFFRQWLAERNLGLVPLADPSSFDWPGQWIAVVDGPAGLHAVVMFGSRAGVWLAPSGAYDGAAIPAGWLLTPLDLHLPTDTPYGRAPGVGTVAAILVAPAAEAPLAHLESVEAVPGKGLAGDRYAAGRG